MNASTLNLTTSDASIANITPGRRVAVDPLFRRQSARSVRWVRLNQAEDGVDRETSLSCLVLAATGTLTLFHVSELYPF